MHSCILCADNRLVSAGYYYFYTAGSKDFRGWKRKRYKQFVSVTTGLVHCRDQQMFCWSIWRKNAAIRQRYVTTGRTCLVSLPSRQLTDHPQR